MRINRFIAQSTGMSRRKADSVIKQNRVKVNTETVTIGMNISESDSVTLDDKPINIPLSHKSIALHKPVGYVSSRDGQGSRTIYDLLPEQLHNLKPIGRLDKDSSGLLLLTTNGNLAHKLTHPSFNKIKIYKVTLDKPLSNEHQKTIKNGVTLEDGESKLNITSQSNDNRNWQVSMHEGRNRQIRRSFEKLGYQVINLHRISFGEYTIDSLESGKYRVI